MADNCKDCRLRGDLKGCLTVKCADHDNWVTMELWRKYVAPQPEDSSDNDLADKECTHPKGYIKSVRICGACGEQLSG